MKVNMETIDTHKRVFEIEIPQPEVAKAIDRAYHKLAGQVNIPGFRKGKVPRNVLEMRLGKPALMDEAFEILASPAYARALKEQNVDPVTRPEIEIVTFQEDQPLVFKATVTAKPEITIGEYKGLKVETAVVEITEEQVTAQLQTMRTRQAKMVVMEGISVQNSDFAVIDFEGFVDGVAFEGGAGKAYPLEIGSGTFIPGFEEQLLGAKAGEERDVNVTFPEEYQAAALAGKQAVFKVKVQDVKRKEIPELDDDFAKDVSDFETLEELKADLKAKLERTAADKAVQDFNNAVVKQAVENATVDIPEIMIEDRIDDIVEDMRVNLQNRGMQLEKYMEYIKTDLVALRESYKETALSNVKTELLLEAVAKAEGLEVTPEDIQAEILLMAEAYKSDPKEVAKVIHEQGRLGLLGETVLHKKARQLILDSAVKE